MVRTIEVKKSNKLIRIPKEIREEIKRLGISSKIKFMQRELIECPMTSRDQSPIICMTCNHFLRRIKGKIYCKYP